MTAARFCQNNFAAATDAVISVSSALAGFPASNAVDPRRSFVWITSGAFRVVTSTGKIYINDGSDKDATLTPATYATPALMAAHIQTQLNAVSTNWTCTYSNSTKKFTIGRSSGTAILRLSQTTNAAWDMLGFTGSINDNVGTGKTADDVRVHTSERFRVAFGAAKDVSAFFAIGNSNEEFPISSAAVMRLKGDDIEAMLDSTPEVDISLARENTGIFKFLDEVSDTTQRYWEFEFQDRTNPNGPQFSFSQLYFGDYVSPLSRSISRGFSRALIDPSVVTISESQAEFVKLRRKYWIFESVAIEELSESERSAIERLLYTNGTTIPFFVSIDPSTQISESLGEMTKYVRFDTDSSITHRQWKYFSVLMRMREVVR